MSGTSWRPRSTPPAMRFGGSSARAAPGGAKCARSPSRRSRRRGMRVTFVTSGLEHLGVAALSAYVKAHGHESALVYEPKPFSSNSGPDSALFARLFEPTPEETARRIAATHPDAVAFSSYTITHRWSVEVARALKQIAPTPIVFGAPHASRA